MLFESEWLYFDNIPKGYKDKEKVYYIGLEFSGIQKYIFGELDVKIDPTEIGERSAYVIALTNKLESELETKFSKYEYINISKASGKFFSILKKGISIDEITGHLNELQVNVFEATHGKLEIYYGIQKVKLKAASGDKNLPKSAHGELIKKIEYNKFRCINLLANTPSNYEKYKRNNILIVDNEEKKARIKGLGNSFSAIKYDLDNLGEFFKNIIKSDILQEVSEALNKAIELAVKDTPYVISLFTGGDDIFLLCPTEKVFFSAAFMEKRLKQYIEAETRLSEYTCEFSVSAGIQVINNNLPIFIYNNKTEQQLEFSKRRDKNKISINDVSLTWSEFEELGVLVETNKGKLKERWPSEYTNFYNDVGNLLRRIEQISSRENQLDINKLRELFDGS